MSVEQLEVIIPSNPADRAEIVREFDNISNSFVRITSEKELIKETIAALAEKYDLPKKILNKMSKIHFSQSVDKYEFESSVLVDCYKTIVGVE